MAMTYVGQHVFVDEYNPARDRYTMQHYRVRQVLPAGEVLAAPIHGGGPEYRFDRYEYCSSDFSEVECLPVTADTLDEVANWCGGSTAGTEVVVLPVRERTVAAPTGTTLILLRTAYREIGWRVRTATGSIIQEAWF